MVLLHLPEGSFLHSRTLAESRLGSVLGLNVVAVIRNGRTQLSPDPAFTLQAGDRLLVEGHLEQLSKVHGKNHLVLEKEGFEVERLVSADVELVEAHLYPGSSLIGQTLQQVGFRHCYTVVVMAILRERVPFMPNPAVAVLLAPIALSTASDLSISPYPLMMAVAVSASAAFFSARLATQPMCWSWGRAVIVFQTISKSAFRSRWWYWRLC